MKLLKYKGYYGSYELSEEDNVFFGKLEFIKDLVNYEAETAKELKTSFQDAVEDYLETCQSLGKEAQKPFKGSFNVRIGEELHEKVAIKALELKKQSINAFVKEALEKAVG